MICHGVFTTAKLFKSTIKTKLWQKKCPKCFSNFSSKLAELMTPEWWRHYHSSVVTITWTMKLLGTLVSFIAVLSLRIFPQHIILILPFPRLWFCLSRSLTSATLSNELTGSFSSVVWSPIVSLILRCMSGAMVTGDVGETVLSVLGSGLVLTMLVGLERTYGGRTYRQPSSS